MIIYIYVVGITHCSFFERNGWSRDKKFVSLTIRWLLQQNSVQTKGRFLGIYIKLAVFEPRRQKTVF